MNDRKVQARGLTIGDIPPELIDDLRKLHGLPPHKSRVDVDLFLTAYIQAKYPSEMINAAVALVIEPQIEQVRAARARTMSLRDFKKDRPEVGTTILAFSPGYKRGDPMRWRFVQVLAVEMAEVAAYMTMEDLESKATIDSLFLV